MHKMKSLGYDLFEYEALTPFEREALLELTKQEQEEQTEKMKKR